MTIPPVTTKIEEKVMDNTIAKGGGDNFADNWIMDNKGDATAGVVSAVEDVTTENMKILDIANLETVFVDSVTLASTCFEIRIPEFFE